MAFSKFGRVRKITMKQFYAFVDYEDHESAVEAIKQMNGTTFVNGEHLSVQQSLPNTGGERSRRMGPARDD